MPHSQRTSNRSLSEIHKHRSAVSRKDALPSQGAINDSSDIQCPSRKWSVKQISHFLLFADHCPHHSKKFLWKHLHNGSDMMMPSSVVVAKIPPSVSPQLLYLERLVRARDCPPPLNCQPLQVLAMHCSIPCGFALSLASSSCLFPAVVAFLAWTPSVKILWLFMHWLACEAVPFLFLFLGKAAAKKPWRGGERHLHQKAVQLLEGVCSRKYQKTYPTTLGGKKKGSM